VSRYFKHSLAPLILLLTVTLTVGFFTFRDYGLSWDEPLFYNYADSIWKAYTPQAFAPGFDFEQVYGKSGDDHKTRGPAYLLLARPFVSALESTGVDMASAWHLVNFLTFQLLGVGFFYLLALRWVRPSAAFVASILFATQPLLWGHAFINPKDTIFLAFFIASINLGFNLVDKIAIANQPTFRSAIFPGIIFGLTISVRILAPLAGLMILLYALLTLKEKLVSRAALLTLSIFGFVALAITFLSWPYLWANPLIRFREVLQLMSEHPATIQVLFSGQLYRAYDLPWNYLPKLLALTLTEPVWPLFAAGIIIAARSKKDWKSLSLIFLWFIVPLLYVVIKRPPLSDNFRHFLFIIPPIFLFAGLAFNALEGWLRPRWAVVLIGAILLAPGIVAIQQLHPYEYTYYNSLVGGTNQVNRLYETDYWLTCYKESTEWVRSQQPNATLHVQREPVLAETYGAGLIIKDLDRESESDIQPGDWLLLSTRANIDIRSVYRKLPVEHVIGRGGAEFCIIKRKN